jgi:hypothetical protein
MTDSMKEREKAFENKFVHDQELRFKAEVRRNKLIGLWAAERLGKSGDEAEAYARDVVKADFAEAGDEDVFRKIRSDFDAAGIAVDDATIRRQMHDMLAAAILHVQNS